MITEKLQVKTPTKEEYKEVVQCMLDNGNIWIKKTRDFIIRNRVFENSWEKYREKTIVHLDYYDDNTITYGNLSDGFKTYTSEEFLDKYGKKEDVFLMKYLLEDAIKSLSGSTWKKHEEDNLVKDNNKNMNIKKFVKTLTLSKEDKLLREYGLQNDCGDFTEEARDLVINKLVEDNKAYLVEISTQLKEEDKK